MSDAVDVAIVGAGPYGLSVAAHLRGAGVSFRQFGLPMHLWRDMMPRGMFLKSQGFASNLSDPERSHTLEAFCRKTGHPYASYGLPVPLDTFISYGQWFADELVPGLEEVLVTDLARTRSGFDLSLSDGSHARARNVVLAAGVEHFARVPQLLAGLGPHCTHPSQHTDLAAFAGQRVIVVGAGQSALESAALMHESGADVHLVARADEVKWNGQPLDPARPLPQRMAEPESGLGSGWSTWFYSRHPELFRLLPERTRTYRARTALGPAGGWWLRARVEDQFPVLTGHAVTAATAGRDGVSLSLQTRDGISRELGADHVIAATGYRPDLTRLSFLDSGLRDQLSTVDGSVAVDRSYQSSVQGLHVIGPAVAPTMGPVMRFVYGSEHASTTVARQLAGTSRGLVRAPAPATR
ncbi:MAG TPA: FAD-dependent oxidoreductase [Streptosporangiaceae bacterium]|jgi:thioredoxin reductase